MGKKKLVHEVPVATVRKQGHYGAVEGDLEILVVDTPDGIKVYNGICPHLGGPMLEAKFVDGKLRCPWHDYEFEAKTGKCRTISGMPWAEVLGVSLPTEPTTRSLVTLDFDVQDDTVRIYA